MVVNPCNATLTTATVTDEVVAREQRMSDETGVIRDAFVNLPDGVTVQRQGDRLLRVDLNVLECVAKNPAHHELDSGWHVTVDNGSWHDDWPGATPHTASLVSDAEVGAAVASIVADNDGQAAVSSWEVRRALEAAAQVREAGR